MEWGGGTVEDWWRISVVVRGFCAIWARVCAADDGAFSAGNCWQKRLSRLRERALDPTRQRWRIGGGTVEGEAGHRWRNSGG